MGIGYTNVNGDKKQRRRNTVQYVPAHGAQMPSRIFRGRANNENTIKRRTTDLMCIHAAKQRKHKAARAREINALAYATPPHVTQASAPPLYKFREPRSRSYVRFSGAAHHFTSIPTLLFLSVCPPPTPPAEKPSQLYAERSQ